MERFEVAMRDARGNERGGWMFASFDEARGAAVLMFRIYPEAFVRDHWLDTEPASERIVWRA